MAQRREEPEKYSKNYPPREILESYNGPVMNTANTGNTGGRENSVGGPDRGAKPNPPAPPPPKKS
jgi:hypothetical protein